MALTNVWDLRQILSNSMAQRLPGVQDLVFNSNPITRVLRDKKRFKSFNGPEIRVSLEFDKFPGQWIAGADIFGIPMRETVNDAVFTPKTLVVPFGLTGSEIRSNQNDRLRVHNLIYQTLENVENSAKDIFEISLHGDGTGGGGREIVGFGGALPIINTAGVYGGIDRSLHPQYRPGSYDAATDFVGMGITGWDSTTARRIINKVTSERSKGSDYPDLWIMDFDTHDALNSSMVALQRIVKDNGSESTVGFDGLEVATPVGRVTAYCATGVGNVMPANTAYALNSKDWAVYERPGAAWDLLFDKDGLQPLNQDAIAQGIIWEGEFINTNPRYSARVEATPTA